MSSEPKWLQCCTVIVGILVQFIKGSRIILSFSFLRFCYVSVLVCFVFILLFEKKSFPKFWLGVKLMPNTKPIMTLAVLTFPVSSILIASPSPRNYFLASLLTPHLSPPPLYNYSSPSPFLCSPRLASNKRKNLLDFIFLSFYFSNIFTVEMLSNWNVMMPRAHGIWE